MFNATTRSFALSHIISKLFWFVCITASLISCSLGRVLKHFSNVNFVYYSVNCVTASYLFQIGYFLYSIPLVVWPIHDYKLPQLNFHFILSGIK